MVNGIDADVNIRSALQLKLAKCRGAYLDVFPKRCWKWWAQKKEDGNRESLQFGMTRNWLVGRNRKDQLKGVDVAGDFMVHDYVGWVNKLIVPELAGTLLDGELFWPGHSAPEIATAIAEGKTNELSFAVFDCMFYEGVDVRGDTVLEDRLRLACHAVNAAGSDKIFMVELFKRITPEEVEKLFTEKEWEGLVFKKPGTYYDQQSPDCWQKLKSEKPIDVFVVGVKEGKAGGSPKNGIKPQLNGKAATFNVGMWDGKKMRLVGVMSHLADEDVEKGVKEFSTYRFQVAEATASGWDGRRFRSIRFKRWRVGDKTARDCRFEEQMGGAKREEKGTMVPDRVSATS